MVLTFYLKYYLLYKYHTSRYTNLRNDTYNIVSANASIKSLIIAAKIWAELDVAAYEGSQ